MEDAANNDIIGKLKRILFGFIGITAIIVTLIWWMFTRQFINHAETAKGTVVALNAGGSHPQIKFTTKDGREIEYPQGGLIGGYQVGNEVNVLYDPENPRRCELDSFGALWGFMICTAAMGVCFLGAALFLKF